LAFSAVFEGSSWVISYRKFRPRLRKYGAIRAVEREKNPTNFAVLFEDTAALAGIVVAFFGVLLGELTGSTVFDAVASLLIGAILATAAWCLGPKTKGQRIGESANGEMSARPARFASGHREMARVSEVLPRHLGPDYILAGVSMDATRDLPAASSDDLTE